MVFNNLILFSIDNLKRRKLNRNIFELKNVYGFYTVKYLRIRENAIYYTNPKN